MKNKFWNEASYGGAILGLVNVAFSCVGTFLPQGVAFVINVATFVVTLYLLFYFTKRRADQFVKEGYTYAQCLGFMVAMGIFAGIILGAYQIVASNFLFTEQMEQTLATTIGELQKTGVYDGEMIKQMSSLMHSYMFSPIAILWSQVFGNALYLGFLGLFISVGTKREPVLFEIQEPEEQSDDVEEQE